MVPGADGSGDRSPTSPRRTPRPRRGAPRSTPRCTREICAVPAERLVIERELLAPLPSLRASIGRLVTRKVDRLSCVRFGSARYSVPVRLIGAAGRGCAPTTGGCWSIIDRPPGEVVAEHPWSRPGEASILDEHYGGPRPGAAAGGAPENRGGEGVLRARPGRGGVHHRRRRGRQHPAGPRAGRAEHPARRARRARRSSPRWTGRSRSAGGGPPTCAPSWPPAPAHRSPPPAGDALVLDAARRPDPPAGRLRHRRHRAGGGRDRDRPAAAGARPRSPGCAGSSWPRCASSPPSCCVTAKTQRWAPEELLRTLVEAEITARDASNARTRLQDRRVPGDQDPRRVRPRRVLDPAGHLRLPRLAWNGSRAAENLCLVGPAGTGKSHLLVALGVAAVDAGHRVRYFTAAELVETLYRGLADNCVGRVIDTLLRNDLIICRRGRVRPARRHRRPAAVPVRRRRLRTPRPRHRLPLALRVLGPVPARTHHRRQPARPAPAPRQRRRHRRRVLPHARSPSPTRRNHHRTS